MLCSLGVKRCVPAMTAMAGAWRHCESTSVGVNWHLATPGEYFNATQHHPSPSPNTNPVPNTTRHHPNPTPTPTLTITLKQTHTR